jgi:2-polyprenyl-6-methoxyphenol hydroxylase-like FAD-dependent oxidoreductase
MTPNLGQGGCVALEDGVELAAAVTRALHSSPSPSSPAQSTLEAALRRYEARRAQRCLPLTVRSNLMGAALQLPLAPVSFSWRPGHSALFCCTLQGLAMLVLVEQLQRVPDRLGAAYGLAL